MAVVFLENSLFMLDHIHHRINVAVVGLVLKEHKNSTNQIVIVDSNECTKCILGQPQL